MFEDQTILMQASACLRGLILINFKSTQAFGMRYRP